MSSDHEEIQVEVQDFETQGDDNIDDIEEPVKMEGEETTHPEPKKLEKEVSQAVVELIREPGKSLLPFARVQKIIKADKVSSGSDNLHTLSRKYYKEIPVVAKEATFLISFATEEFIKRLCQAAHYVAQKEKRSIVQHRDIGEMCDIIRRRLDLFLKIAAVVRRADEFLFLEGRLCSNHIVSLTNMISEIMPWISTDPEAKRPKPQPSGTMLKPSPTLLDRFVGSSGDQNDDKDIVLHADGTMES